MATESRHKCCICGEKRYERYMTSVLWQFKPTPLRTDSYTTWVCEPKRYYGNDRCLRQLKAMPEAVFKSPAGDVKG